MGFWNWFLIIVGIIYFISICVMIYSFVTAKEVNPNIDI
jgi:hypothetical protein